MGEALKVATQLAQLGKNRNTMLYYKMETKGFVAKEILNWEFPEGKAKSTKRLPKGLQAHVDYLVCGRGKIAQTWAQRYYSDLENGKAKRQLHMFDAEKKVGHSSKL